MIRVADLYPGERADRLPDLVVRWAGRPATTLTSLSSPRFGEVRRHVPVELAEAGFTPIPVSDSDLARFLEEQGRLVRVGDGQAIGTQAYEEAKRALVEECERVGKITLARFRDLLGISRRPAQLLLERFDADGLTRRVGDERVLRRAGSRK